MPLTQRTGAVRQLVPLLFVQDIESSMGFYRDRLGFQVDGKWEPEGKLAWCRLQRDGSAVMLQQACDEDGPAEGSGRGICFFLICNDACATPPEFLVRGMHL